jgi:hypothetical protein
MKNFLSSIKSLFSDEHGNVSMKRLCGLLCTITLCATLYQNSFTESHIAPSTPLVDAVALLAFGCLGLSSIDKIWGKKPTTETEVKTETEATSTE